jgi:hypothetical protein
LKFSSRGRKNVSLASFTPPSNLMLSHRYFPSNAENNHARPYQCRTSDWELLG